MSTIIKFDLKELKQLVSDKKSCVVEKTVTQSLTLGPWCLGNLKESIKKTLDFKIGKFVKELNGILISYKNLRVLQNIGSLKKDKADINFQVQGDFFVFQPCIGAKLKGIVIKKSNTHIVVLLHRVFNVIIPRPTEESAWIGVNIQENQDVTFKIAMLDLYGALPYIRGELDERLFKFGHDGDEEAIVLNCTTVNTESQQQINDKAATPAPPRIMTYIGPNKSPMKYNGSLDNSTYYRHIAEENDVNLHTKNKNKRRK